MTDALRPSPRATDPALQAIFDAMLAYMGDTYPALNAFANFDAGGTNVGINVTDYAGSRWSYSEFIAGVRVAIEPAGVVLGPGGTQQFTATATNPDGSPVVGATFTWAMQAGATGTITAGGLYTAPATIPVNSFDTVRCQLTGGTSWATVTVQLAA